jgi:polyferredoxin
MRSPFKVDVVRDRASLARLVDNGYIENVYRLQIMNATEREQRYVVTVRGLDGAIVDVAEDVRIGPAQARWVPAGVRVPPQTAQALGPGAHPLEFSVERLAQEGDAAARVVEKSTFVVPR